MALRMEIVIQVPKTAGIIYTHFRTNTLTPAMD